MLDKYYFILHEEGRRTDTCSSSFQHRPKYFLDSYNLQAKFLKNPLSVVERLKSRVEFVSLKKKGGGEGKNKKAQMLNIKKSPVYHINQLKNLLFVNLHEPRFIYGRIK